MVHPSFLLAQFPTPKIKDQKTMNISRKNEIFISNYLFGGLLTSNCWFIIVIRDYTPSVDLVNLINTSNSNIIFEIYFKNKEKMKS